MLHQLLRGHDIAFSYAIENWGLAVGVEMVYVGSLFDQNFDGGLVALADSVVDRQLLEAVFLRCFDAFFDEKLD